MKAAVKPAVEGAGAMKTGSTVEPASANESASAAKPASTVKASTTTMKSAATAVKASATTVATTLRKRRFNAAKNYKHGDCKESCRKVFFHFSSSDQATSASRATLDCL
jgi:hypothetical protein